MKLEPANLANRGKQLANNISEGNKFDIPASLNLTNEHVIFILLNLYKTPRVKTAGCGFMCRIICCLGAVTS